MHQPISSYLILNKLEHFLLIWNCTIVKMFFRLVTSVGQRKILSPHEESNLRPSALRSTTEPQRLFGERGLLRSSNDTRPAYRWDQLAFISVLFRKWRSQFTPLAKEGVISTKIQGIYIQDITLFSPPGYSVHVTLLSISYIITESQKSSIAENVLYRFTVFPVKCQGIIGVS